jgi:hypothetical protein
MAGGSAREFIQDETFTLMTERTDRFAMNGASSTADAWKAFDGDTTTTWNAAKGAFVDVPLPMGVEEGTLRVKLGDASAASKLEIFAGERKVQEASLADTPAFQEVTLESDAKDAASLRVVVTGPAEISELEIR